MYLSYQIFYSDRRTIGLTVERDGSVIVRAPVGTTDEQVRKAVEKKRLWLYEKINSGQKYPSTPHRKEFVSGESLLYLGRHFRLEITDGPLAGVHFNHKFVIARTSQEEARALLRAWYIERAQKRIPPIAHTFAQNMGVAFNRVRISELRYRWGSCTPLNNLNFNWRIMKAPPFVIDYLAVHELAHLLEPNHTPQFWNIVSVQVPRCELAKDWLREHGNLLEEDF